MEAGDQWWFWRSWCCGGPFLCSKNISVNINSALSLWVGSLDLITSRIKLNRSCDCVLWECVSILRAEATTEKPLVSKVFWLPPFLSHYIYTQMCAETRGDDQRGAETFNWANLVLNSNWLFNQISGSSFYNFIQLIVGGGVSAARCAADARPPQQHSYYEMSGCTSLYDGETIRGHVEYLRAPIHMVEVCVYAYVWVCVVVCVLFRHVHRSRLCVSGCVCLIPSQE